MIEELQTRRPLPSDEKYYDALAECDEIKKFVYFTMNSSSLIVYKDIVVGFFKLMKLEDNPIQYEIELGIFPQYQRMGIARMLITNLEQNVFSDEKVQLICMNIDKDNKASLALANSLGYEYNENKEDFYLGGNNRTLEYVKYNPIYEKEKGK